MSSPIDFFPLMLLVVFAIGICGAVLASWGIRVSRGATPPATANTVAEAVRSLHQLADSIAQPELNGGADFMARAEASMLRIAQARATGAIDDIAALVTPAYYGALVAEAQGKQNAGAPLLSWLVEVSRLVTVSPGHPRDQITAWFGVTVREPGDGGDSAATADGQAHTMVAAETVRFVRAAGIADKPDPLAESRICHNCGGSLTDKDSGRCPFCGQVTVGNDHGWLVAEIDVQRLL